MSYIIPSLLLATENVPSRKAMSFGPFLLCPFLNLVSSYSLVLKEL